jgi:voltage-gated potassium channel
VQAERRVRWERSTTATFLVASGFYLFAYSWLILEPGMFAWLRDALLAALALVWLSFIVDVLVRIGLTPRGERLHYVREHKLVILSAIIPILRPFSLLRHLRKLPGFRGNLGNSLRSRLIFTVASYEAMFVYVLSLGVLAAERGQPHANIETFGDSVWWAAVTLATVGYGDYHPVTVLGRCLAILLMAGGVVIIGTASATIISSLNERVAMAARRAKEEHDPPES